MQVDVTTSSQAIHDAVRQIGWYDAKSRLGLERAIGSAVRRMAYKAKTKVPRASGSLRDSIFSSMKKRTLQGAFGAKKPHAHLIEYGVKESVEEPVKAKALEIPIIMRSSHVAYRRRAIIPKRGARPFIEPSYKAEEPKLLEDVEKVLKKP